MPESGCFKEGLGDSGLNWLEDVVVVEDPKMEDGRGRNVEN